MEMESLKDILSRRPPHQEYQVHAPLGTPRCATCGAEENESGFVGRDVPPGDPSFGKPFPCPECSERKQLRHLLAFAQLPKRFQSKTFANFYLWDNENKRVLEEQVEAYTEAIRFAYGRADFVWLLLAGSKGWGKALALDTPIATPSGWSTMGDLKVGDEVFDEKGLPTKITFKTLPMFGHKCYKVGFSDGSSIIADAEHLWLTTTYKPYKTSAVRTTEEIAKTLSCYGHSNHRIPVAPALVVTEKDLPIPPYTLGAWLGDGDSDRAVITAGYQKEDIQKEIKSDGVDVRIIAVKNRHSRLWLSDGDRTMVARNKSIQSRLRKLGLLDCKHIPMEYLRASPSQRLRLLQGLMDTDGSIDTTGRAEISSSYETLARDIAALIRTLGYKAMVNEDRAVFNGKDYGLRWRIHFTPYEDTPVFTLSWKNARQGCKPKSLPISTSRMITSCEEIDSVPVCCIKVANDKGLFLAGESLVITHNTHIAAAIINERIANPALGLPAGKFINCADLTDELKKGFDDDTYNITLERYKNFPLLMLDDLGAEYHGNAGSRPDKVSWAEGEFYKILNYRYDAELPTVITTNVKSNALGDRIADRMLSTRNGFARNIYIEAPSARSGRLFV